MNNNVTHYEAREIAVESLVAFRVRWCLLLDKRIISIISLISLIAGLSHVLVNIHALLVLLILLLLLMQDICLCLCQLEEELMWEILWVVGEEIIGIAGIVSWYRLTVLDGKVAERATDVGVGVNIGDPACVFPASVLLLALAVGGRKVVYRILVKLAQNLVSETSNEIAICEDPELDQVQGDRVEHKADVGASKADEAVGVAGAETLEIMSGLPAVLEILLVDPGDEHLEDLGVDVVDGVGLGVSFDEGRGKGFGEDLGVVADEILVDDELLCVLAGADVEGDKVEGSGDGLASYFEFVFRAGGLEVSDLRE